MTNLGRRLVGGALLALGVGFLTTPRPAGAGDEDEQAVRDARKALVKLARSIRAGKLDPDAAREVARKYELEHVSWVFKPRTRGGLGVGPRSARDGIEVKWIELQKRPLSRAQLARQKQELVEMAYVTAAVAEVTKRYPVGGARAAAWKKWSGGMSQTSLEFVKAVRAGDPRKVKVAAEKVNATCNGCHAVPRAAPPPGPAPGPKPKR